MRTQAKHVFAGWSKMPIFLLVFLSLASANNFAQDTEAAPSADKKWQLGLSETLGLAFSEAYGYRFVQVANNLAVDLDFAISEPLWGGLSLAWQTAAASATSEEQFVVRPGWDAANAGLALALKSQDGFLLRADFKGTFSKVTWLQFYQFFLSAGLGLAQQFKVGPMVLEAGIVTEYQFRQDPGVFFLLSARLRFLF